ncbi:MAG: methionine synthase [Methanomicrobiales archaeon]|nr:methionine synthase [Methanomicrobiales archaeon]NYT21539.1 methionine synthase [Methanomicrobiales archaeon]
MTRPHFGTILPTTVVGSYPVVRSRGISGLLDPFREAVKAAVADQIAAGIDIISDGQVRGDMVGMFTGLIPGIRGNEVIGPVSPAAGPITVPDTRYAISRAPRVKGIITGPSTLSFALHIATPSYRSRGELALDLAGALSHEAVLLEEAGISMIQIDEPILSTGAVDPDAAAEAIRLVTGKLSVPVCLHVCGNLSDVLDDLVTMPVDILDGEFARSPENLSLFREVDVGEKMIGFGCIDSSRPEVEEGDRIRSRIEDALTVFGPDQLLIDPDCGLRMLPRESAFSKLSRMVEAVRTIREDF